MQALGKMTIISAITGVLLSGCSQEKVSPEKAEKPDTAMVQPEVIAPEFDAAAADTAMNRPLDGSSVEAFERGLKQLESELKPADLKKVQSALGWMMFYDLAASGDKAKLYASLDGATPKEIIAKAGRKEGQ